MQRGPTYRVRISRCERVWVVGKWAVAKSFLCVATAARLERSGGSSADLPRDQWRPSRTSASACPRVRKTGRLVRVRTNERCRIPECPSSFTWELFTLECLAAVVLLSGHASIVRTFIKTALAMLLGEVDHSLNQYPMTEYRWNVDEKRRAARGMIHARAKDGQKW